MQKESANAWDACKALLPTDDEKNRLWQLTQQQNLSLGNRSSLLELGVAAGPQSSDLQASLGSAAAGSSATALGSINHDWLYLN